MEFLDIMILFLKLLLWFIVGWLTHKLVAGIKEYRTATKKLQEPLTEIDMRMANIREFNEFSEYVKKYKEEDEKND